MKNYIYIIPIILFVLGISACSDWEEVTIAHEPYLNIYANVSSNDIHKNFVNVYRTTGFGEPDFYEIDSIIYHQFYNESSGDTITYQTFYIDTSYAVNDAKVYFLHDGDTIRFYEWTQGIYKLTDTTVNIVTGDNYDLRVETEDYGVATASEKALQPIAWTISDTTWISLSNPVDTLRWTDIGGVYDIRFMYTYRSEWSDFTYTYLFESERVEEPFWAYDTSKYDDLFNYDPFQDHLESDYNPDTLELGVSIVAYSESYLDYKNLEEMQMLTGFIRYPTINDFRVNIDNALGAFTSMSVSERRVVMFVK